MVKRNSRRASLPINVVDPRCEISRDWQNRLRLKSGVLHQKLQVGPGGFLGVRIP